MRRGGAESENRSASASSSRRCDELCKLAAQRLARVRERVLDQPRLGAALRHADLDLALGLRGQRLGEQLAVRHVVRNQD